MKRLPINYGHLRKEFGSKSRNLPMADTAWNIVRLIHDGVITIDDMTGFSNELRDSASFMPDR